MAPEELERLAGYHRLPRSDSEAAPHEYETRCVDRAGRLLDVIVTIAMIPRTERSVLSLLDISERKHTEDDRRLLTLAIEQSAEAVVITDRDGTIQEEALKVFCAQLEAFDLVITDQTMPQMTGSALAQQILQVRPSMPIILCSGHTDLVTAENARARGFRTFVVKPLVIADAARVIRSVLDEKPAEAASLDQ